MADTPTQKSPFADIAPAFADITDNVLFGDVFCDDIVCHVTGTTAKVAAGPQVAAPKLFLQVREFGQQVMRRTTFQPLPIG